MTASIALWLRRLASPRRPPGTGPQPPGRGATAPPGLRGPAGLIGAIHLHLWLEGYRQIPTDEPLFLLDAVAGLALATVLLGWDAPLAGLPATGYTAATLGALLISLTVGLFGFRESISASFVAQSLVIETITVLALSCWNVLVAAAPRAGSSPARHRPPVHQMSRDQ